MMENEDPLKTRLAAWQAPPPDGDLAGRIARRATTLPQRRAWLARIADGAERALTEWRYAFAYKLAVLTLCAAAGLAAGLQQGQDMDVVALAFEGPPGESL